MLEIWGIGDKEKRLKKTKKKICFKKYSTQGQILRIEKNTPVRKFQNCRIEKKKLCVLLDSNINYLLWRKVISIAECLYEQGIIVPAWYFLEDFVFLAT